MDEYGGVVEEWKGKPLHCGRCRVKLGRAACTRKHLLEDVVWGEVGDM